MLQASVSQVCMATKMYNRNTQMVFIKRNAEQILRIKQLRSSGRLWELVRVIIGCLDGDSM